QRPATPAGRDAQRQAGQQGQPGQGADLPGGDRADVPPEQPEDLQDGEVTAPPAPGQHAELPEHGDPDDGEQRGQDRGGAVDAGVVGDAVAALAGHYAGGLLDGAAEPGHGPLEAGDVG